MVEVDARRSGRCSTRRDRRDASLGFDLARLGGWLAPPADAGELESVVAAARAFERGEWSLFGHRVTLADPPDWNRNPLSGASWPDAPSRAIDYRRAGAAGGAKFTWELGRLTFVPDLALAARASGDRALARRAARLLEDFARRNPLGHGLHQTSGIEMAIRVANTLATLSLAEPDDVRDALEPALGLAAQQALWCRAHRSVGSSANNHLLAEDASVAIAAALLPGLRGSKRLARAALGALEAEVEAQFHADGVNAEQAFGYLPFVWELLLLAFTALDRAGHRAGDSTRRRLRASLEFARAIRLADGSAPQVGDEDDGRVLLASHAASRLDLVGNALAAWLGEDALSDGARAYAELLRCDAARTARAAADGRHEFPAGGWTVWRERGLHVTFDHGPLGLGALAAHGHADALAVTVFRGADGVVVDPGTLAYHDDDDARARTRATASHATVNFGGRDQSESLGPFLWGRRASVAPEGDGWRCTWRTGETHARSVGVADGVVTIEDRVRGRDPRLVFPLAPGASVETDGARAVVATGGSRATFEAEGVAGWTLERSEHAPRFSHRVPASRLVARVAGERAVTRIATGAR